MLHYAVMHNDTLGWTKAKLRLTLLICCATHYYVLLFDNSCCLRYTNLDFTTSHFIPPHRTSSHLTSPHLTSHHLTSPHITSHFTQPKHTSIEKITGLVRDLLDISLMQDVYSQTLLFDATRISNIPSKPLRALPHWKEIKQYIGKQYSPKMTAVAKIPQCN
jgi:hypothetical protein